MLRVGIIGYGSRMGGFFDRLVETGEVMPAAIADPRIDEVKQEAAAKGFENVNFYTDAEEMLEKETLDGICIGTRCSQHTQLALLAAKYDLPIFLEKPVATNEEDLKKLESILHLNEKIVVSFPLRFTKLVQCVKEIIDSGKLGKIEHVQAYNNVPYGHGYYHKWYRDENETGGLFLQKTTHDFDYINYLLGDNKPVRICAMKSKQIFKGDMPEGMLCENCDKQDSCPESPKNVKSYGDRYIIGKYCCFAKDTGNQDSGSAIVEYESGMHVVYTQNFFARKGAQKRGARLLGYYGTVEFDWYTGVITVYRHMENVTETYHITDNGVHFGGDNILAQNFVDVMKKRAPSKATLAEGILSARMCLMAKNSSINHQFYEIG